MTCQSNEMRCACLIIKSSLVPSIPNYCFEGDSSEGLLDVAGKEVREDWTMYDWTYDDWDNHEFGTEALTAFLATLPTKDYYLAILGEELNDFKCKGGALEEKGCPFWTGPVQILATN